MVIINFNKNNNIIITVIITIKIKETLFIYRILLYIITC